MISDEDLLSSTKKNGEFALGSLESYNDDLLEGRDFRKNVQVLSQNFVAENSMEDGRIMAYLEKIDTQRDKK